MVKIMALMARLPTMLKMVGYKINNIFQGKYKNVFIKFHEYALFLPKQNGVNLHLSAYIDTSNIVCCAGFGH